MSKHISTVTIASPAEQPHRFFLIRADLPEVDKQFVWCGKSLGWLPYNRTTMMLTILYASMESAEDAAEKFITLPLLE